MADPKIRLKRSSVEGKIPTPDQVPLGEIALNTYDGYLYASKNVGIGTTVIAINPFRVGAGTDTYNAYFTAGNVGIGSTLPTTKLDVDGTVTATSFAGSGANLTGLTGASAATYGSSSVTPVITVDSGGRITGISTVATSGSGGSALTVKEVASQGGATNVTVSNVSEIQFNNGAGFNVSDEGSGTAFVDLGSTFNPWYVNGQDTLKATGEEPIEFIAGPGIAITTKAVASVGIGTTFSKAITFTSTGISNVVEDTTPQLGGNLDLNSNNITGTGNINITGIATATGFSTTNGTSSQFLKADGSVDSSTYLTSYTETDPVVAAINGIVKSNGTTISAATAGTDYLTDISQDTTPQLGGNLDVNAKNINFGDSASASDDRLTFGAGTDLSIYHNGSSSYIDNDTGNLFIRTNVAADVGGDIYLRPHDNENGIVIYHDGGVHLNYNNSLKLYTTSSGVIVSGILTATSFVKSGGTSSQFLKADGSVDSSTYLTSYTETQTLNDVLGLGNTSSTGLSVGVVTTTALKGFDYLQAPHGTTVNYAVTVATKTAAHRYNGSGSSNGYVIDGVESPFLTFTPGRTYRFTLSSGDMSSHPFRFYLEADRTTQYTTNVTSTSTYTEIVVTDTTPTILHYQCSVHAYMGNAVQVNSNKVDTPYQIDGLKGANITGIVTATGFSTTTGTSSQFLKADGSVDGNTYLTSYTETDPVVGAISGIVKADGGGNISAATAGTDYLTPSGDGSSLTGLTGASAATYGSASATPVIVVDSNGRITGISTVATSGGGGGISNVVEDTTPQLGGDLDLNSKNITGTGNMNVTGIVTATSFSGSGSSLTGLTGASAATYGSSSVTPVIVVDSNGRITGISTAAISGGGGGSVSEAFKTIAVSGQSDVVADSATDTLTLVAGSNMTITTNAGGDSVTFASSGGGGGSIGIQSGGISITSAASTINFVGTGITMSDDGSVTDIYIPIATRSVSRTVATQSQTTITGLTYSVGYVDVYLNGSKLDSTEFTATDGTSVVLTTGASANDVIEIVAQNISATTTVVSGISQSESIAFAIALG